MLVFKVVEETALGDPREDDEIVDRDRVDRTVDQQIQPRCDQRHAGSSGAGGHDLLEHLRGHAQAILD